MLSVSRLINPARTSTFARIVPATMLMIVLLAGAVPFSSFASAHECGMACCAFKPSHMAGSCSTALTAEEQEAEASAASDEDSHAAHNHQTHHSGATSQGAASTKHHKSKSSSAHHSKSKTKESSRTASVASQFMTTPCSPECATAASASSQVRRPRDPLAVAVQLRPRPPTIYLLAGCFTVPSPKSAEGRRLSRPRAPPVSLDNLPA